MLLGGCFGLGVRKVLGPHYDVEFFSVGCAGS